MVGQDLETGLERAENSVLNKTLSSQGDRLYGVLMAGLGVTIGCLGLHQEINSMTVFGSGVGLIGVGDVVTNQVLYVPRKVCDGIKYCWDKII